MSTLFKKGDVHERLSAVGRNQRQDPRTHEERCCGSKNVHEPNGRARLLPSRWKIV
uniref:Uncharacterized protein n=1 Tax=Candidatus Kentrum sp. FM TaxID=2126340 RepID=A0A450RY35_9GAMM|nr:MAG: hypothetical protein BECKFM1743C_GA0114222_100085 [Candidatus Kentron sp. FM]